MLTETDPECCNKIIDELGAASCDNLSTTYLSGENHPEPVECVVEVQQNLLQYRASSNYLYLAAVAKIMHAKTNVDGAPPLIRLARTDKTERIRHFHHGREILSNLLPDKKRYLDETLLDYQDYVEKIAQLDPNVGQAKRINNVMLTGATGFLGCHILFELLRSTPYTIHLPIRAQTNQEALGRLESLYQRYFQTSLTPFKNRIVVLAANVSCDHLGLDAQYLVSYAEEIDSIIHCAASTDYLAQDEDIEQANVTATANVLKFAELTGAKDFHFISCLGVLDGCKQSELLRMVIVTEDTDLDDLIRPALPLFESKMSAERLVHTYRTLGVHGTIYRTGNLIAGAQTNALQKNRMQHSLFAQIQAMLELGIVPDELAAVQVSEVGLTARAIVKLFDKKPLFDQTYHVFNPELFNLRGFLATQGALGHVDINMIEFIKQVKERLEPRFGINPPSVFHTLVQLWSRLKDSKYTCRLHIAQKKTAHILAGLGFYWVPVTQDLFCRYFDQGRSGD